MGTAGGGANLNPASPSNWSAAWGGIPQVPNPGVTAGAAIGANTANLGPLLSLGGGINAWSQAQAQAQMRSGLPLYDQMVSGSSRNILSQIQGQVPDDVIDQILRTAAERGIITGTTGSENANAAMLRALGLTSLDLMQRGEQALTAAVARTPRGQLFDPTGSGSFVTGDQMQEAQMAANIYRSAPVPSAAGTRALGAASSGLRAGMAAGGGVPSRNMLSGPSWDKVRQTPETAANSVYGGAYGGTNMELLNAAQRPSGQDWYNMTFGGPGYRQFAGGGGGFSNIGPGFDPDRYYADPTGGGYYDLDTGDYYG